MSQLIVCRECGVENVSGSKFCNNCGTKLPPATHIICPNCEAVNPIDRIFCDKCGTRLVSHKIEDDEQSPPASPTTKVFSLPTRRPGDTGKLDPGVLPDWLRTGETEELGEESDEAADAEPEEPADALPPRIDTGKLPRVEDLTPEKPMTDDLPDWLVNEGDSDPIIDSPEGISTELFLDLVSKAEEEGAEETPLDTTGADLPDWLVEAGNLPDRSAEDDDEDDGFTAETELAAAEEAFEPPLWLAPDDDEPDAEAAFTAVDDDQADFSVTDWLSEPDEEADAEMGQADDLLAGLTDWLADSEPAEEAADETAAAIDEEDAELSDWLMQLNQLADAGEPADAALPETESRGSEEREADWTEADDHEAWLSALAADTEEESDASADDLVSGDADEEWLASLAGDSPPDDEALVDEIFRTFSAEEDRDVASEFTDLFALEGGDTGELPEWLADVAAEGETLIADEDDDAAADLDERFAKEEMAAQSELDWLMQTGGLSLPAAEGEAAESDAATGMEEEWVGGDTGGLDWLSELASLDTDTLRPQLEMDDQPDAAADGVETAVSAETAESEPAIEVPSSDPWESDLFPTSEEKTPEELPDWLSELGPPGTAPLPDQEEVDSVPAQELPDWLTDLRPDESVGDIDSSLPSALTASHSGVTGELEGIPDELAGADLPEWLESSAAFDLSQELIDEDDELPDVPEWLEEGKPGAAPSAARGAVADDWDALLDELPPPAKADELAPADIPDWLQDLKPGEQAAGALLPLTPVEQQAPAEEEGPLVGLPGVVKASVTVTDAQRQLDVTALAVTPAQQEQAALLRQLTQGGQASVRRTVQVLQPVTPAWVRILLAVLLLAALLAGLLLPQASGLIVADGDVTAVYEAVEAAAGRPVLMAFEYTPAMIGELTPAAETLAAQLAANDSPILTISQYATGVALAKAAVADENGHSLGYLPGEAIGLRALGDCLGRRTSTCMGVPNWEAHQALLADVALVVVLAGERDSLLNWIEQVQSQVDAPVLLVVPQSLAPVAAPYLASGQLAGVLAGAPATTVYQTAVWQQDGGAAPQLLADIVTAQSLAQLVAVLALLVGMIVYGLFSAGEKPQQAE